MYEIISANPILEICTFEMSDFPMEAIGLQVNLQEPIKDKMGRVRLPEKLVLTTFLVALSLRKSSNILTRDSLSASKSSADTIDRFCKKSRQS